MITTTSTFDSATCEIKDECLRHLSTVPREDGRLVILRTALRNTGQNQFKAIRVSVSEKAVTLIGTVDSFYLKQLAQEAIRPHVTGLLICNRLHVASPVGNS